MAALRVDVTEKDMHPRAARRGGGGGTRVCFAEINRNDRPAARRLWIVVGSPFLSPECIEKNAIGVGIVFVGAMSGALTIAFALRVLKRRII